MSENDYVKIEATISARQAGNLDPTGWAHSHIVASGLAGMRNPLGHGVMAWMERETECNATLLRFLLATEVERQRVACSRDSVDVATDALRWFQGRHCPECGGRGVLNFEQQQCPQCSGTGERHRPSHKPTADAVGIIYSALDRLEGQLRARLRGSAEQPTEKAYRIAEPKQGPLFSAVLEIQRKVSEGY